MPEWQTRCGKRECRSDDRDPPLRRDPCHGCVSVLLSGDGGMKRFVEGETGCMAAFGATLSPERCPGEGQESNQLCCSPPPRRGSASGSGAGRGSPTRGGPSPEYPRHSSQHPRQRHPRIGAAARQGARPARLAGQGFARTYDISYRGLKLPRVSAGLGRCYLQRAPERPWHAVHIAPPGRIALGAVDASLPFNAGDRTGPLAASHWLNFPRRGRSSPFSARIGTFPGWALRPFTVLDPADDLNDGEHDQGAHSNRSHDQPG